MALLRQLETRASETNKLRYIHSIRGSPRHIAIKEREINDIINHRGNYTIRYG